MIEIKTLTSLESADLQRLIIGYISDSKYVVRQVESEQHVTFTLDLIVLEQPYVKRYPPLDEDTLDQYQNALRHGLSLGAYDGDQLVGLALAEPHFWNVSLWIHEFHVAEGQRGKGIGRALMDALAEKGRAAGLRILICETQTTNVPAIRFYRRVGFTLDGIDLSHYSNSDWPDSEIALFMKRPLTAGLIYSHRPMK